MMRQNKLTQLRGTLLGLLALLALLTMQNVSAASPGVVAYQAERYPEAFRLLTSEARGGDSEAQYLLGTLYLDGLGVKPSLKHAISWLKKAVENRHPVAAQTLGKLYMSGMGLPMDVDKGIYYMGLADQFTPDEEEEECD